MKKRNIALYILALALACAASAWAAYRLRTRSPLYVRPQDVSSVELRQELPHRPDVTVELTDPEAIRAFCERWNGEWVTRVEPFHLESGTPGVDVATGCHWQTVVFHTAAGGTRTWQVIQNFVFEPERERFYFCPHDGLTRCVDALFPAQEAGT